MDRLRALGDRLPVTLPAAGAVAFLVVVGLAVYGLLVAPKLREVQTLRTQLADLRRADRSVPEVTPVTDSERDLWKALEGRLRQRYPPEADLPRAIGAVAELARTAGLQLLTLEIQPGVVAKSPAAPAPPPLFQPPPELALNTATIRLAAAHRYRDLVEFVDRLPQAPVYVALRSLEVRRVDDHLTSEASFASLRWAR